MLPQTYKKEVSKSVLSPKRSRQKILPKIHQKPVPLHNNSSQHFYKGPINSEMQLQLWAYVDRPGKKQQSINKYTHYYDCFYTTKSRINLNPEKQYSSSLLLLDQYFKRKQLSKLRQIVKIPAKSKQEGISSIGFQGINFHQNRQRRTLQGFFKQKRNSSCHQMGPSSMAIQFSTLEQRERVPVKKKSTQNEDFPSVDYYFVDKDISLVD